MNPQDILIMPGGRIAYKGKNIARLICRAQTSAWYIYHNSNPSRIVGEVTPPFVLSNMRQTIVKALAPYIEEEDE